MGPGGPRARVPPLLLLVPPSTTIEATGISVDVSIRPGRLRGEVTIPASKSHTIRALIIATLAEGESRILHPLDSGDARACIAACRALGAEIEERWEESAAGSASAAPNTAGGRPGEEAARGELSEIVVRGTGGRIASPERTIDVMNSGTTLYLAAAAAALGTSEITFDGDKQIRARPIQPLLNSLTQLGASVRALAGNGCAPVAIRGPLAGGFTSIEAHTSQYLSSLLLACPLANGDTEIDVPLLNERPYVEMTLRWLDQQGIRYRNEGFRRFYVPGRQHYTAFKRAVPGDFSSATFFLCAAAITGSTITLRGLDMRDAQGDKEVVNILARMGCRVETGDDTVTLSGPGADAGARLRGREIDLNAIPDALPALAVTACCAEGTTRLVNVPQARQKETDRITVMHRELQKMGARIEELPDGLVIEGGRLHGAAVDGHDDHRVVMALAVAGLVASGETVIADAEAASVTFPGFFRQLESVRAAGAASNGRQAASRTVAP